jgi:hypothetical protein
MTGSPRRLLPVDGHVHFHSLDRVAPTLEWACRNFEHYGVAGQRLLGALLLVESARETVFERLQALEEAGSWSFRSVAGEPATLIAASGLGTLAVVCGRQVRCERGLEVLAYGTLQRFDEGEPIGATLERVVASGAMAALPWGFGKWRGGRAGVIRDLLRSADPGHVFVGDNGGRVHQLPEPRLLQAARAAGFRVLPGSDPFPFGGDEARVGAYGFLADIDPSPERPWTDLRAWIEARSESPAAYGKALGVTRFVFNQLAIQVYNRVYARAAA